MKNQRGLRGARRLFFVQTSLVAMVSLLVWALDGIVSARSIGFGGLVWVIPQVCFALMLFKEQRVRFSQVILKRAYKGEAFKLLLSALLFAGVFRWGQVAPLMFFMGYMLTQMISWFAPLFFREAVTKTGMRAA
ncbi:MAG: ATP synthase subunit I [Gammaproteobacteria bacterium]|nr:ATP synthase subunit I [Gammaproteobacteria bacterium]